MSDRTPGAGSPDVAGSVATGIDGPPGGLAELYRREFPALLRFGYLVSGDPDRALDLVQDAFAALQPRYDGLADPSLAGAYVRVTMLNAARRERRRLAVWRAARPRLLDPVPAPSVDGQVLARAADGAVVDAVRRLPRRQREVIALRYWSDLTEAQIAQALSIAPGTVKSTAARALRALAGTLGEDPR